jgi:DNA-binding LacI/PurR family transcriptional regulator
MTDPRGRPSAPTMRDVAGAAGVSTALVSIVFRGVPGASDETRARVLSVAKELGYVPNRTASMMKRSRTRHLGVAMNVRSAFHGEMVEGIQAAAQDAGYEIVLSGITQSHPELRAVETLTEFRCESLILLGCDLPTSELRVVSKRVPVVLIGRRVRLDAVDIVRSADHRGMALLVDHLVGLGHTAIAHVDGGDHPIAAERGRGYRAAMRGHGLGPVARVQAGGGTEQDGQRAAARLLALDVLPTAVSAFNDHCALGIIDALTKAGVRVPEDCSVTGYDNSSFAELATVNLTTVSQEASVLAETAVRTAIARIENPDADPTDTVLQPRLMVRGSSGPARADQGVRRSISNV